MPNLNVFWAFQVRLSDLGTLEVVIPQKKMWSTHSPSLIELGHAIFENIPEQKRLKSISSSWVK